VVDIAARDDESAAARWKSRYLEACDAQERLERDAGERVAELGRLLARLSRSLPGPTAEPLARRMAALAGRLEARPLDAGLSREVGAAGERVLELMDACEREHAAMLEALSQATSRLEQACGERTLRERLAAFRSSLRARGATPASELVGRLQALQAHALDALQAREHALAPAVPVPHPAAAPAPARAAAPGPGAGRVDWDAVRGVLASLIADLDLPQPLRGQAEALTRALDEDLCADRLLAVLEAVRELAQAAVRDMRREFRGFLDSVDRRLDGLLAALGQAREDGAAARALERGISDSFEASLTAIRRDAAGATGLEELKTSIDGHLERLVSSLQEFRSRGEALGGERDARLEAMTRRLQALERESRNARGQLETQRRLARTDALTGLPNRKALEERLAREIAIARERDGALSLALADIDHFKSVNDRYGHRAGDRALKLFAGILSRGMRESDFCARYGGEEFLILLPGTDAPSAARAVEQVRAFVERCGFCHRGEPVPLTASFGVTGLAPAEGIEAVLERADCALYAAKREGRNRVCVR